MPGTQVTLEESTPIRSSLASGGYWCSLGGTATGVGCELMCQSRRQSTVRPLHVEGVTGVKSPTHNLKMSSALALLAGPALVTSKRELFRARSLSAVSEAPTRGMRDTEPVCALKHARDSRLEMWIHAAHRLR